MLAHDAQSQLPNAAAGEETPGNVTECLFSMTSSLHVRALGTRHMKAKEPPSPPAHPPGQIPPSTHPALLAPTHPPPPSTPMVLADGTLCARAVRVLAVHVNSVYASPARRQLVRKISLTPW